MNYSNLQNLTNYIQSSPQFELVHFYLQSVNLPGISSDPDKISTRARNRFNVAQDTLEFNQLSFEMLIDENLEIWLEFQNYIRKRVRKDGFDPDPFFFTIQVNNNKGNKLFNVDFHNCYITSIGDIQLDSRQDMTHHTLQVDIQYDHYEIVHDQAEQVEDLYKDIDQDIEDCPDDCECKKCLDYFDSMC